MGILSQHLSNVMFFSAFLHYPPLKASNSVYLRSFLCLLTTLSLFHLLMFLCSVPVYSFRGISISLIISSTVMLLIFNNYMFLIQFCLISSTSDLLPAHFISINMSSTVIYNLYKIYITYPL